MIEKLRTLCEEYRNHTAEFLHRCGFSPNQLTLANLAFTFLAGWAFAMGHFFLGSLIATLAGLSDALDGPLARRTNRVTKFGAFLDSTIDRYSDCFLFCGLAMYFSREGQGLYAVLSLGSLTGALVTSYAKARAENMIESCKVGLFTRPVRYVVLLTGTYLKFLLPILLWILFIGTNTTAIQRILHTKKQLGGTDPDGTGSQQAEDSDEPH